MKNLLLKFSFIFFYVQSYSNASILNSKNMMCFGNYIDVPIRTFEELIADVDDVKNYSTEKKLTLLLEFLTTQQGISGEEFLVFYKKIPHSDQYAIRESVTTVNIMKQEGFTEVNKIEFEPPRFLIYWQAIAKINSISQSDLYIVEKTKQEFEVEVRDYWWDDEAFADEYMKFIDSLYRKVILKTTLPFHNKFHNP